jgi:hypothetical protein
VKKHIKVTLTHDRSETIGVVGPISAEAWLQATRNDGAKVVVLNGVSYPKDDLISAVEVKAKHGSANMEGI